MTEKSGFTPPAREIQSHLEEIEHHLTEELVPFWMTHGVDEEYGGFLTYFDRDGSPTGETVKTLICQTRMIYAFARAHLEGFGDGYFLEQALQGARFVSRDFTDAVNGGYFWTVERDGTPRDRKKIVYGHSFVIYANAELLKASRDFTRRSADTTAVACLHALDTFALDRKHGGFFEFFEEDWQHCQPGVYGGDRKSLDVHMHLMEAFTNWCDATADWREPTVSRRRFHTRQIIDLICDKMLHPEYGTGLAQFAPDWTPLRAIQFKNVWGSDRDADDPEGRPLDNTSYGHNVELGWLLSWAIDVLELDREKYAPKIRRLYDHCLKWGIDWDKGGVFCEGPGDGPARERNKEFWQQAETLVAMLDGVEQFGDERCWEGYKNVHRFVMDFVINHEVGEWFALLDENNNVLWDYMGHAWKINYHTMRSMLECRRRLMRLLDRATGG